MNETKYPCPCGKSTYTVEFWSDDWNRDEQRHTMNCVDCVKKYAMSTRLGRKGVGTDYFCTLKKKPAKKIVVEDNMDEEKILELKNDLLNLIKKIESGKIASPIEYVKHIAVWEKKVNSFGVKLKKGKTVRLKNNVPPELLVLAANELIKRLPTIKKVKK